ncbi:MAG: AbrB/MazE/SpoVT family DNA-binding domain-containing protein [Saprospiraceae bacterium]
MKTTVNKWGNSLAIRLPKSITEKIDLHEGSVIELSELENRILIKKRSRIYSLEEIVKSYSKDYQPDSDWSTTDSTF